MKKRRASNGGSQFPEAVIQHIQSFMSVRDAAKTSAVSKSWHLAWSTAPDLDLDQRLHGRLYSSWFLDSARKRIQRYEDSNLVINSFRLSMDRRERSCCKLADELTLKALKLGARKLSLSVCLYLAYPISPVTINAVEFRNLNSLCLGWLDIFPLFSKTKSSPSDFPCLKVLTLNRCFSLGRPIYISIASLDSLTLDCNCISSVDLDVPSIRRFKFSGFTNALPALTFQRAPVDWDSDLTITHTYIKFNTSWFLELEAFLKRSSMSKVSLSLEMKSASKVIVFNYDRGNYLQKTAVVDNLKMDIHLNYITGESNFLKCLLSSVVFNYDRGNYLQKTAVVDNLKMDIHLNYITGESNFLKCLLSSVEPKFITQSWKDLQSRGYSWKADNNYINLLCKALMLEVTNVQNGYGYYTSSLPRLDHVECFEKALAKWQPSSLKALLDASAALEDEQLIRFQLQWR